MTDTVQMNLNVLPTTKARVAELANATFRGKGDVVDLAVAELYERVMTTSGLVSGQGTYPYPTPRSEKEQPEQR